MKTILDLLNEKFNFRNEKENIKKLIGEKADFSLKTDDGRNYLHFLAKVSFLQGDELEVARQSILYALECGCKFTDQDKKGCTPLHYIALSYSDSIFQIAIENGGEAAFNIKEKTGNTPLHWFCSRGKFDLWSTAVKMGADPYIKNNAGEMTFDVEPHSLNPAGKKSFYKNIEKVLKKLPQGIPAVEIVAPPVWSILERKEGEALKVRGVQTKNDKGSISYFYFYKVNDKYAMLLSETHYMGVSLETGSILWQQRRFYLDGIDHAVSYNDIWYAGVGQAGSSHYVIAIDPQKGFTPVTKVPEWMTLVGSSLSFASYGSAEFYTDGGLVMINIYSCLAILNSKTGKLVKAKFKHRTSTSVPFLWEDRAYSQCIQKNKVWLTAIDISTGEQINGFDIELKHIMAVDGNGYSFDDPLVYNDKLLYMAPSGELVVVDLKRGVTIFEQMLPMSGKYHPNVSCFRIENGILHIFEGEYVMFDIGKMEFLPTHKYPRSQFIEMTKDKLYLANDGIKVYDRKSGKLVNSIDHHCANAIVTSDNIIYTCSLSKDKVIEIEMIY
ncbi:MAG: hypothetical protein LBV71_15915 [Prevotella sp.]|jgi:hypothetical protein|nr:hypothetical protein [Prevotella sp.]